MSFVIFPGEESPARIDLDLPGNVKELFPQYLNVLKRYGKVIYGLYVPGNNQAGTEVTLS